MELLIIAIKHNTTQQFYALGNHAAIQQVYYLK